MTDLEVLKKFVWCEPLKIDKPGDSYHGYTHCFGTAKTRWRDGSEQPLSVSILFEPEHDAFDLKTYIDKFHSAILSIRDALEEKGAQLIEEI